MGFSQVTQRMARLVYQSSKDMPRVQVPSVASGGTPSPAMHRQSSALSGLAQSTSVLPSKHLSSTSGADREGAIKGLLMSLERPMDWLEGAPLAPFEHSTVEELHLEAFRMARKWNVDIGTRTAERITA
jgi:hypothetical protein